MGFANSLYNLFAASTGQQGMAPQAMPAASQADFGNARYGDTYIDLQQAIQQRMAPYNNVFDQMQANLPPSGPNLVLPNSGFFASHPRVSRGVENALFTLGNMGPASMNAGDNISNVARGLIGGAQQQRSEYINRASMPLQIEMQKLGLEDKLADSYYKLGHAAYFMNGGRAMAASANAYSHYVDRPDGLYGIRPSGQAEKVQGIPGKPVGIAQGLKTLPERQAFLNGFDPENDPVGFSKEVSRIAAVNAGMQGGARTTASTQAARKLGDLSETDRVQYDSDRRMAEKRMIDSNDMFENRRKAKSMIGRYGITQDNYKDSATWDTANKQMLNEVDQKWFSPQAGSRPKAQQPVNITSPAVVPSTQSPQANLSGPVPQAPRLTAEQMGSILSNIVNGVGTGKKKK